MTRIFLLKNNLFVKCISSKLNDFCNTSGVYLDTERKANACATICLNKRERVRVCQREGNY